MAGTKVQPPSAYVRVCQECGKKQSSPRPPVGLLLLVPGRYAKWAERPCKFCKSPALDYGTVDAKGE